MVLTHLEKLRKTLFEMIRVTKKGGCVAVFDNASVGIPDFYDNVLDESLEEKLFWYEIILRFEKGRKKLKRLNFEIGRHVPGWMEEEGLLEVQVMANEIVNWIVPPYRSIHQQYYIQRFIERHSKKGVFYDRDIEDLRAGGASDEMIERYTELLERRKKMYLEAISKKTCAISYHYGSFWCIWRFNQKNSSEFYSGVSVLSFVVRNSRISLLLS